MNKNSFEIVSLYGNYQVHFNNNIGYDNIIKDGDVVVMDRVINKLYEKEFSGVLNEERTILIDATEQQKSYEGIAPLIEALIDRGFHRNNKLIAVGGGVTQDVVAFIASVLYRGVKWELIPTTLLAQCDSCIGSKTSINFRSFKNQIGGFYPPRNVYISQHYLNTLNDDSIRSGMGEMLHYFVIGGEDAFRFFADNYMRVKHDTDVLEELILRSLEIKKKYIEIDEFDRNERQVFNYGHSFGHAIETLTNYRVPHGIAVSHGIDIANYVSMRVGLMKEDVREAIRDVAMRFWSPDDMVDIDAEGLVSALRKDKKNIGKKLGLILCKNYGDLSKCMVEADDDFHSILSDYVQKEKR